jgi:hypothetical protein
MRELLCVSVPQLSQDCPYILDFAANAHLTLSKLKIQKNQMCSFEVLTYYNKNEEDSKLDTFSKTYVSPEVQV